MPRTVWYPGHMAKGTRKLKELAEKLDLIIEVRDSRAPISTAAPFAHALSKIKPVIRVLSKKDLALPENLNLWLKNSGTFAVDLREKKGLTALRKAILKFKPSHREVRLAIVGIPNVGKSMLLNSLIKKSNAIVGGIPGVTKSVNWYRNDGMLIVDSPGILDPHAEPGVHLMLSWLGCAKADAVGGWENAALSLIKFLKSNNMLKIIPVETELDELEAITLEKIGIRFGCLISGGRINTELAARRFIESFSSGKLGLVSLESPGEKTVLEWQLKNNEDL